MYNIAICDDDAAEAANTEEIKVWAGYMPAYDYKKIGGDVPAL